MAKEFKEYDRRYSHLRNRFLSEQESNEVIEMSDLYDSIEGWDIEVGSWNMSAIKEAVYNSKTADAWQQFRVSLKGNTTRTKLLRLYNRWQKISALEKVDVVEARREIIRIDNYIGALVRGGLLTAGDYRIRRN